MLTNENKVSEISFEGSESDQNGSFKMNYRLWIASATTSFELNGIVVKINGYASSLDPFMVNLGDQVKTGPLHLTITEVQICFKSIKSGKESF